MSIYSYVCRDCPKSFSVSATLAEKEAGTSEKFRCPACRSRNTASRFSLGNFLRNIFSTKKENCCASGSCCTPNKKEEACCAPKRDED